jgi:RNase P subunit RPR2
LDIPIGSGAGLCDDLQIGMTRDRRRGYCARCRHQQVFERSRLHHGVHFFLSVITGGLWLVSWLSIYIGHRFRPWRCLQCGWHKPLFADSLSV